MSNDPDDPGPGYDKQTAADRTLARRLSKGGVTRRNILKFAMVTGTSAASAGYLLTEAARIDQYHRLVADDDRRIDHVSLVVRVRMLNRSEQHMYVVVEADDPGRRKFRGTGWKGNDYRHDSQQHTSQFTHVDHPQ